MSIEIYYAPTKQAQRLPLHEVWAELPLLGQGVDGGFVERLFALLKEAEKLDGKLFEKP